MKRGVVSMGVALVLSCFHGGEREKEPPPGLPGGFCLQPAGACDLGRCDRMGGFCYDPEDPCEGFFCGGSDRGTCEVTAEDLPACQCKPGFHTRTLRFYCCPEDAGEDPACLASEG